MLHSRCGRKYNKEIDRLLGNKPKTRIGWKLATSAIVASMATLGILYFISLTNNKFISKYRTIYIETALSTMSHQWLATKLLPYSTVDEVKQAMQSSLDESVVESSKKPVPSATMAYDKLVKDKGIEVEYTKEEIEIMNFRMEFPEIDMNTIPEDMDISDIDVSDACDLGIKTLSGERVWALNTKEKIVIIELKGTGYVGKLVLVGEPQRVKVATNGECGYGKSVRQICEESGAILGVNAGGFSDYNGMGNGGRPIGVVKSEDKVKFTGWAGSYFQFGGFDHDDNFLVGRSYDIEEFRDAVEFYPAVIVNGEKNLDTGFGMGVQPRTIIGQTADRRVIILAVDGRRAGYSIGITLDESAEILLRYNTWSALNMDGGASTALVYKGETINRTSNGTKDGRGIPNAWVVMPLSAENLEVEK